MTGGPGIERRVETLENAVEYLKRGQDITNEQLAELIRLGERQVAQKEALERAFGLVGRVTERTEAIERRVQILENTVQHEDRADKRADFEKRIKTIEIELPTLKLVRGWVVTAALAIVVAAAALVWDVATERRFERAPYPVAPAPATSSPLVFTAEAR